MEALENRLKNACSVLEAAIGRLKRARQMNPWRFSRDVAASDPSGVSFDDSRWLEVDLPHRWKGEAGDFWLRKTVTIPHEIDGLPVGGKLELRSTIATMGTEVFCNGRRLFYAPYWSDFRLASFVLSEDVRPGEGFHIAIHAFGEDTLNTGLPEIHMAYESVESIIFSLEMLVEELRFGITLTGGEEVVEKALDQLRLSALERADWEEVERSVLAVRNELESLRNEAKSTVIHAVGHAHIDMNWMWPWEDTLDVVRRDFETIVKLMEEETGFRFSQSQAFLYYTVERLFPHIFRRICSNVASGRWEPTASTWVEGDLNMASGEAIARHLLYSKRYVREKLGYDVRVCWEPDTFGHPVTMPQILKRAGVDYYCFLRGGKGEPLFWWESPDGSKVLAFNESETYNNVMEPQVLARRARHLRERTGINRSLFVYGVGDHGGGPTRDEISRAKKMNESPCFPAVRFSSAQEFFEEVSQVVPEIVVGVDDGKRKTPGLRLPIIRDELNCVFDGCYTTHADIKRHNRKCENTLGDAEVAATINWIRTGEYPARKLWNCWNHTLFNQFHDILDGSGIGVTYEHSNQIAEAAEKDAEEILQSALSSIFIEELGSLSQASDGISFWVFNPVAWTRDDIVVSTLEGIELPENPVVVDSEGNASPVQVSGGHLIFAVRDVPGIGFKKVFMVSGNRSESEQTGDDGASDDRLRKVTYKDIACAETWTLENENLKAKIDPSAGTLKELWDKRFDRKVMADQPWEDTGFTASNLLQVLYEIPHPMSAWIIGRIRRTENLIEGAQVRLVENGPVRGVIRVNREFANSEIEQDIILYRGLDRVDFQFRINWREHSSPKCDAPMLKLAFTPLLKNPTARFEVPFGAIERPRDGREVPALRWIDLSDNDYGVSLFNDSKYGFDVNGNTMRMTLLRTPYEPDSRPDAGLHVFSCALYPHAGDTFEARTQRRAEEFNHPLRIFGVSSNTRVRGGAPEMGMPRGVGLPEGMVGSLGATGMLEVENLNIMVSCFKPAEDGDGLVLRVYEAQGKPTDLRVRLGFKAIAVEEVDLIERAGVLAAEVGGGSNPRLVDNLLRATIGPWQIRTYKLKLV